MLRYTRNGQVTIGKTEMNFVSFGSGNRVLVVLPGLSDGLATVKGKALFMAWPFRKYLDKYQVFVFSRKNWMPMGYTIREMAGDQAAALNQLGISNASVLGVSEGGMIAQYLAIDFPDLVAQMIIAVSTPHVNELIRDNITTWIQFARQGNHKQLIIDTAEKSYSQSYLKKFRKAYPLLGFIEKPKSYNRFLINAEAILKFNAVSELNQIICPTFIIGGEEDKIVGIHASHELQAQIKNSVLYVYPGLGHAAYEEADDFYDRVFRFLDKPLDDMDVSSVLKYS